MPPSLPTVYAFSIFFLTKAVSSSVNFVHTRCEETGKELCVVHGEEMERNLDLTHRKTLHSVTPGKLQKHETRTIAFNFPCVL